MIRESKRPFIYSGGGIIRSNAHEELMTFAELIQAPVSTSLMGIGGFPETHRLSTGLIGMHGSKASNMAATECDLLIAIGARFSDRVTSSTATFAPNAKVLHIDVDPAEIAKNVAVYNCVVGDAKEILLQLTSMLEQKDHNGWLSQVRVWSEEFPFD